MRITPEQPLDASARQALEQIAAQIPSIRQDLARLVSRTTPAPASSSSPFIASWTVSVAQAASSGTPQTVLSRVLPTGQTAGGLLVSNPTSNTLLVMIFANTVPEVPSEANALQSLVLRPYSWQTIPTVAWRAVAVQTHGAVVSPVKTALLAAFTTIAPGSGRMQEDMTSASTRWWVETSLIAGDTLSLTSPWGGSISLDMISTTLGVPMSSIKVGPGFSGKISGSIAGGLVSIGENFSGTLQLNSVGNVGLKAGNNNAWNLTMNRYGQDSRITLGDNVGGIMVWQAQTSILTVANGGNLSSTPVTTSIIGSNLYGSAYNGDDVITIGEGSFPLLRLSSTGNNIHYNCVIDCANGSYPAIYLTTGTSGGSVYHAEIKVGANSAPTIHVEPSSGPNAAYVRYVRITTGSNLSNESKIMLNAQSSFIQNCDITIGDNPSDVNVSVTASATSIIENFRLRAGDGANAKITLKNTGIRIQGVSIDREPSSTGGVVITADKGATIQDVSSQVGPGALSNISISAGTNATFSAIDLRQEAGSYLNTTIHSSGDIQGLSWHAGPGSWSTLSATGTTKITSVRGEIAGSAAITLAGTTVSNVNVVTQPGSYADLTISAPHTHVEVGEASSLTATVKAGPTRVALPPATDDWLLGSPSSTISGNWTPGNRPLWFYPSHTFTASFTSPVLTLNGDTALTFLSNITAVKSGSQLTWTLQSEGKDGSLYPVYTSTAITAARKLVASFGPGLQYNIALGQRVQWTAEIVSTTTSTTTPSITGSFTFQSVGGMR